MMPSMWIKVGSDHEDGNYQYDRRSFLRPIGYLHWYSSAISHLVRANCQGVLLPTDLRARRAPPEGAPERVAGGESGWPRACERSGSGNLDDAY